MSIIEKLISKLFSKQIAAFKFEAYAKYELEKTKDRELKEKLISNGLHEAIGKKIIYCPNEWSDPLFAIATGVIYVTKSDRPMLECTNVLTGETSMVHPGSFYYADELLTLAILKLSPFERWNLSVCKLTHMRPMWTKSYPRQSVTPTDELEDKLRKSGFMFESYETSTWLSGRVNGRLSKFSERFYDYTYSAERYPNQSFIITVSLGPDVVAKLPVYSHLELEEFGKIVSKKIS